MQCGRNSTEEGIVVCESERTWNEQLRSEEVVLFTVVLKQDNPGDKSAYMVSIKARNIQRKAEKVSSQGEKGFLWGKKRAMRGKSGEKESTEMGTAQRDAC